MAVFCMVSVLTKSEKGCLSHKDFNEDGLCDICDFLLQSPPENQSDKSNGEKDDNGTSENAPSKEDENESTDGTTNTPEKPSCESHIDNNADFICDRCNKSIEPKPEAIELIFDGKLNFSLIAEYDSLSTEEENIIKSFSEYLQKHNYTLRIFDDDEPISETGVEILINQVSGRGAEYEIDPHYLGQEGYAVIAKNQKIIIRAGSSRSLAKAMEYFKQKAFSPAQGDAPLTDSAFLYSDSVEIIQKNYEASSISIAGISIEDYVITYDSSDSQNEILACEIQTLLYQKSGIWLNILENALLTTENYIAVISENRSGGEGFYVNITPDNNLEIVSEFPNKTIVAGRQYLNSVFESGDNDKSLCKAVINIRDVFYKDFGAVGDGITDDYAAIMAAHDYANKHGHTVVAENYAKYYIASIPSTIKISTSVSWQEASFIIDGREAATGYSEKSVGLFEVISDYKSVFFNEENEILTAINTSGGIKADSRNIGLALGYRALLVLENSEIGQKETILIDENGNVDTSTPILTDFTKLTSIYAQRTDESEIILEDGRFIINANLIGTTQYGSAITVHRCGVTLRALHYEIGNDLAQISPYTAFLSISNSSNVFVTDCNFEAGRTNQNDDDGIAQAYLVSAEGSVSITFTRCSQSNFYESGGIAPSEKYRGALRLSGSKNLICDKCVFSVLYAEDGVYDAAVNNSVFEDVEITENCRITMENTFVYNSHTN